MISSSQPRLGRKTVLMPIIGLVAFFLYIYLFKVDLPALVATAERADPRLYVAAIVVSLGEVFFFAVSWRVLLNFLVARVSVSRSFLYVWYGIFMDILVPAE